MELYEDLFKIPRDNNIYLHKTSYVEPFLSYLGDGGEGPFFYSSGLGGATLGA